MSSITPAQFNDLTVPLKSMTISHAWRGYGSAVFIELGELTKGKGRNPSGKATLMLEWSWRVEGARSIAFGSFSSDTKIESGLQGLVGRTVLGIGVHGRLPEIILELSQKRWICSFSTVEGQPAWSLLLREKGCVVVKLGSLLHRVT